MIVKSRPSLILQIILLTGVPMQQGSMELPMPVALKYWKRGSQKQHIDINCKGIITCTYIAHC